MLKFNVFQSSAFDRHQRLFLRSDSFITEDRSPLTTSWMNPMSAWAYWRSGIFALLLQIKFAESPIIPRNKVTPLIHLLCLQNTLRIGCT
jgi:hypothetical protein